MAKSLRLFAFSEKLSKASKKLIQNDTENAFFLKFDSDIVI
jgi:hypothetical protein